MPLASAGLPDPATLNAIRDLGVAIVAILALSAIILSTIWFRRAGADMVAQAPANQSGPHAPVIRACESCCDRDCVTQVDIDHTTNGLAQHVIFAILFAERGDWPQAKATIESWAKGHPQRLFRPSEESER